MRYTSLRIIGLAILSISILLPFTANAQLDPRCWQRADCLAARQRFSIGNEQGPAEGFVQNDETAAVCGGKQDAQNQPIGFCLPATKTVTEISFGGKREFANIGEFIQLIYRYAIIVAGILATVVIILAGIRWTASGGNAERIKSAQKMIGGAIVGLVLALLSYTVLSTLNSATVNLRLPQVWLIRPQTLAGRYCDGVPDNEALGKVEPKGTPTNRIDPKNIKFDKGKGQTDCGYTFLRQSNNTSCQGITCAAKEVCAPETLGSTCKAGALAGTITAVAGFFSGTDLNNQEKKIIDGPLELLALCKDGTITDDIDNNTFAASGQSTYFIKGGDDLKTVCGSETNLAGFFLAAEINDEGAIGPVNTAGIDDWHAIGQTKPGSHDCRVNLAKRAFPLLTGGQSPTCKVNECSCAALSPKGTAAQLAADTKFTTHLLDVKELTTGYVCDITISRAEFPAVDNAGLDDADIVAAWGLGTPLAPLAQLYFTARFVNLVNGDGRHTNCDLYQ